MTIEERRPSLVFSGLPSSVFESGIVRVDAALEGEERTASAASVPVLLEPAFQDPGIYIKIQDLKWTDRVWKQVNLFSRDEATLNKRVCPYVGRSVRNQLFFRPTRSDLCRIYGLDLSSFDLSDTLLLFPSFRLYPMVGKKR